MRMWIGDAHNFAFIFENQDVVDPRTPADLKLNFYSWRTVFVLYLFTDNWKGAAAVGFTEVFVFKPACAGKKLNGISGSGKTSVGAGEWGQKIALEVESADNYHAACLFALD
jgi:hypothetical protein